MTAPAALHGSGKLVYMDTTASPGCLSRTRTLTGMNASCPRSGGGCSVLNASECCRIFSKNDRQNEGAQVLSTGWGGNIQRKLDICKWQMSIRQERVACQQGIYEDLNAQALEEY